MGEVFRSGQIVAVDIAIDAMLLTVVFDRDHRIAPAHVQEVARVAVGSGHRYLGFRPRKSSLDQQQSKPRFTRRLRTGVDLRQQASYPPQAFEVWVVLGNLENVVDGEVGRRTQRVESLDSPAGGATAR